MRMFYCPICGKFSLKRNNEGIPCEDELTIKNMLDFSVPPVQHYKCECGNYLAGYFEFATPNDIKSGLATDESWETFHKLTPIQQENNLIFYQDIIMHFNKGGHFYNTTVHGNKHTFKNMGEYAMWSYSDRKHKESAGELDKSRAFSSEKAVSKMLTEGA